MSKKQSFKQYEPCFKGSFVLRKKMIIFFDKNSTLVYNMDDTFENNPHKPSIDWLEDEISF